MSGLSFASRAIAALAIVIGSSAFAEEATWVVRQSSGEVWTTTEGVQRASLAPDSALHAGDTIRTGRTGAFFWFAAKKQS